MDIIQLQTFQTVAELGNYSKAARALHVTQPTITSRIYNLEQELGFKLFTRNNHSVSLTSEGELFLPFSERILTNLEEAKC